MKLTLRKANAVQNAINEQLKGLDLSTQAELNEFEDASDQIQTVRDRFWENAQIREKLVAALYEIRTKVARANATDINDMLANVAYLEKQISHNAMLANKGVQTNLRVLNGQLNKLKESKDDAYRYGLRDVTTSIFTEEEVEQFRLKAASFKRQKQKLQDKLLELNVLYEIELTKDTVEVLIDTGIL